MPYYKTYYSSWSLGTHSYLGELSSFDIVVAIGASTGGTEAIKEVVKRFPSHMSPVLITQHIPPVFSSSYAKRLDGISQMTVHEAVDGQEIEQGPSPSW